MLAPVDDVTAQAGRLDEQLCFALYAASTAMTRAYRPLLKGIGLTYPQYLVMLVLWEHRSQLVGEIAEQLRLATHAMSPIIDRLEDGGLVRRTKEPSDGRAVRVELTGDGADLEAAAAAIQDELRCRTSLEAPEVARLRSDLNALIDQLGSG